MGRMHYKAAAGSHQEQRKKLEAKYKKLQVENKRLRKVLRKISKTKFCCVGGTASNIVAEQALKGE